jgi:hypothetical protein
MLSGKFGNKTARNKKSDKIIINPLGNTNGSGTFKNEIENN